MLKGPISSDTSTDAPYAMGKKVLEQAKLRLRGHLLYTLVTPDEQKILVEDQWDIAKELDDTKASKETGELLLSEKSGIKVLVMWRIA